MCRPGGKEFRCENQYSKSCTDARNARRRANYAASKGGNVRTYNRKDQSPFEKPLTDIMGEVPQQTQAEELTQDNLQNMMGQTPEHQQEGSGFAGDLRSIMGSDEHEPMDYNGQLQISRTPPGSGWLAENEYIAPETLHGTINWAALDETSYQKFGFQEMDETRETGDFNTMEQLGRQSSFEMKSITPEGRAAIRRISSEEHEWINGSLRQEKEALDNIKSLHSDSYMNGREDFARTVSYLDEALATAPYQQRVLYRGLRAVSPSIQEAGGVEAYMSNSFNLGQEVKFDDYLSTSYSPSISGTYASVEDPEEAGIMFEIRTGSGVNIVSESHYEDEKEVLLPRNSRFMVVGVHKGDWSANDNETAHKLKSSGTYVVQLVEITENGSIVTADNRPAAPPALTEKQLR